MPYIVRATGESTSGKTGFLNQLGKSFTSTEVCILSLVIANKLLSDIILLSIMFFIALCL